MEVNELLSFERNTYIELILRMYNTDNMPQNNYYKLNAIKTYCSTEWLAEGKKRYRTVFDKAEVDYLYTEISLHNKQFDRESWKAQLRIKCYKLHENGQQSSIFSLDTEKMIRPDEPIAYIRDGWGAKDKGQYWQSGSYQWEVYLKLPPIHTQQISAPIQPKIQELHQDYVLVGRQQFYIEKCGVTTPSYNPYFKLNSVQLFEGKNVRDFTSSYLFTDRFKQEKTRYIWVELAFKNKRFHPWFCEVFFNFYNSEGQLKGQFIEFQKIALNKPEVSIYGAWGHKDTGTWFPDIYRLDVVFMGVLIASKNFNVH